jgi:hypothetical protein
MSEKPKGPKRQSKRSPKTQFLVRLHNPNYDWLCQQARAAGVSMAKFLNAILRTKPPADDFYIR